MGRQVRNLEPIRLRLGYVWATSGPLLGSGGHLVMVQPRSTVETKPNGIVGYGIRNRIFWNTRDGI